MAGGKVAGKTAHVADTSERSSGAGSKRNPKSSSSSGFKGDKSAEIGKIRGTRGSFNVKGRDSVIEVSGGSINSGYCSGSKNAGKAAAFEDHHPLDEGGGTDQSFNVEGGGKIFVAGSICSGAYSGDNIQQELIVVPPSYRSTKLAQAGAPKSHRKSHSNTHHR